jgi:hypothetical protein
LSPGEFALKGKRCPAECLGEPMIPRKLAHGLFLALTGLVACTPSSPCDDDQELRAGYCYAADASVAGPAKNDAAEPLEAGAAFGLPCATGADCVAPATYCAIQPGQNGGFCSAFGCDKDPNVCPATWDCKDLTPYGLAAHMCIPGS